MPTDATGFDVIGDVHGCGDLLVKLLEEMGYERTGDSFHHPTRRVVFVGDLVDRGRTHVVALEAAKAMVDAGDAHVVLGNHEFNAIAYATEHPDRPGEYLRPHTEKNNSAHARFLEQIGGFGSAEHRGWIDWFLTLPLWLEIDGLRVIHACWDDASMDRIESVLGASNTLTPELVGRATHTGTDEWAAIEILLKGPEVAVTPKYLDGSGTIRSKARFRWWDPQATTLDRGALILNTYRALDGEAYPDLPETPVDPPVAPYDGDLPLIHGHYWESGPPRRRTEKVACVDYSAVGGGPLVAYRWDRGDTTLSDDKFFRVKALETDAAPAVT